MEGVVGFNSRITEPEASKGGIISMLRGYIEAYLSAEAGIDAQLTFDEYVAYDNMYVLADNDYLKLTIILDEDASEIHIRNIEVQRDGLGIGTATINAIHEFAKENDMQVYADNVKDSAIRFWESMGYINSGDGKTFYNPEY